MSIPPQASLRASSPLHIVSRHPPVVVTEALPCAAFRPSVASGPRRSRRASPLDAFAPTVYLSGSVLDSNI